MIRAGGAASESVFQTLVEHSSDAIVLFDANGTVLFASRSAASVLGYTPEERLGRSVFELLHPEDLEKVQAVLAESRRRPGTPVSTEFRARHKDGSWRDIEAIAVDRIDDPSVGGVVVNYRDVTARNRAAEALRASEERLRRLVESAHDLIYHCDPSGRFTYVNPTAVRVTKYEEHELLGRHFLTLIRPDYRERAGEVYTRQIVERTPNTYFEFPVVTKDGQSVWVGQHVQLVYEADRISGVQAIARDISRQKDAEEKLRQSEFRYRSLIQGAAYGIYRSAIDGRILDANPALALMLGYASVDELMTRNMREFYRTPADRARLVAQLLADDGDVSSNNVEWRRKDGAAIVVRIVARVVDAEDGLPCIEGIAEDITAKRALEEQLREAQKMEAVGRLARGVAHDFNNVLAAIVGWSDLLVAQLPEDDPSHDDAVEISRAAERGASLVRQLLAFSRPQGSEPQVLDLHASLRGLEPMLRRLVGSGIELHMRTDGTALFVRAEPGRVEQVVLNLVVNARDAMPDGGEINVLADIIHLNERSAAKFPGMPQGPYARIEVRDTGVGMKAELQPHVFEPFFTTKDVSKGTGLGLSIVYGIVKNAGGTAIFSTAPNEGTTFEVLFPLVDGPSQATQSSAHT